MSQCEGLEIGGKEDHVRLLKKSFYALKQSHRQWYKKFDLFMVCIGYYRSLHDSCAYFRELPNGFFYIPATLC